MNNRHENILLMGVQGFYWCASCVFFGFLVMILQNHGYSNFQCAQIQMSMSVVVAVMQFTVGYLTDTYITCKKYILAVIIAAFVIPIIFFRFIDNFIVVLIMAVVQAALIRPINLLIDSWTIALRQQNTSINYSLTRSAGSVTYAISSLTMGNVIARLGEDAVKYFYIAFSCCFIVCVLALREVPCANAKNTAKNGTEREKRDTIGSAISSLLNNRWYVLFLVGSAGFTLSFVGLYSFASNFVKAVGGDSSTLGMLYSMSCVFEVIAMFLVRKLMKRYPLRWILLFMPLSVLGYILMFALSKNAAMLVIGQAFQGFGNGIYFCVSLEYLSKIVPERLRSTAIVLCGGIVGSLSGIISSLYTGFALDYMGLTVYALSLLAFFAVSLVMFVRLLSLKDPPASGL